MDTRASSSCSRCTSIKQRCEGGIPCSRCQRLRVTCVSSLDGKPLQRVQIRRTSSGCTACKKRKRKCDEARPNCSDCRRLCLECIYEIPTTKRKKPSAAPVNSIAIIEEFRERTDQDSASTPDFSVEAFEALSRENGICWTDSPAFSTNSTPGSDLSLSVLSAAPDLMLDVDKILLNHYIKVVAVVLSRGSDQNNPYLKMVVPVAMSNQLVMNALLALSASHWKRMNPSLWKRGMVLQNNGLSALAKLLPHIRNDTVDGALLATLLLAMVDLYDGSSSHWQYHLDGVRQLLSAFKSKADGSQYRTFFTQLYHYLDSATTISTCHPPLLEAPKEDDVASPPYNADDEASLYGIPKSLFHFVDKLNSLAYQRKFREDPVFAKMFEASASSLQTEIEQWAEEHHLHDATDSLYGSSKSATHHSTVAFEQSLQLRLHQVVNGYSLHFDKVKQCVKNILDAVQEIPYGNPLESSLIFPLVMAGGSCETEYDRLIIDDRLRVMQKTLGFRYVYVAHDLVQRVWREREACEGTGMEVNWASIRFYNIPGLALV